MENFVFYIFISLSKWRNNETTCMSISPLFNKSDKLYWTFTSFDVVLHEASCSKMLLLVGCLACVRFLLLLLLLSLFQLSSSSVMSLKVVPFCSQYKAPLTSVRNVAVEKYVPLYLERVRCYTTEQITSESGKKLKTFILKQYITPPPSLETRTVH